MEEEIEEEVAKTISNDLKLLKMTLGMEGGLNVPSDSLSPTKAIQFPPTVQQDEGLSIGLEALVETQSTMKEGVEAPTLPNFPPPTYVDVDYDGHSYALDFQHEEPKTVVNPQEVMKPLLPEPLTVEGTLADLRRALDFNLQYQAVLKEQLKRVEHARICNQEIQKRLRAFIAQSSKKPVRKPTSKRSAATPFFADSKGNGPPPNADTLRRKKQLQMMPSVAKFRRWNKKELKDLRNGVRQANQQIMFNRLLEEYHSNGKSLEMYNRESERIKTLSEEELEMNIEGIDWDSVAKNHVPTRSGVDCKIQWLQNMHPSISKAKWTKTEDKKLLSLAKNHKGHNWELIAKELETNRTPVQCFKRYQRSLNTNMMKSKWTEEEDKILIAAVKKFGEKNWQQVAHQLEGRAGQQCLHRWQKTLNPAIQRGRWKPEEDMRLTLAVKAYGSKNWIKVQRHVPGRTDVQCRERWVNILNPDLNSGPWTEEEDQKLREAIEQVGLGKWAQVAQMLHPRTDNQCWRRWKMLNVSEVEKYRRTIYKKRKGLVSNFVGRERERPTLTPDDFEIEEGELPPSEMQEQPQAKRKRRQTKKATDKNEPPKKRGRKRKVQVQDEEESENVNNEGETDNEEDMMRETPGGDEEEEEPENDSEEKEK